MSQMRRAVNEVARATLRGPRVPRHSCGAPAGSDRFGLASTGIRGWRACQWCQWHAKRTGEEDTAAPFRLHDLERYVHADSAGVKILLLEAA